MNSHELARKLLKLPDAPVVVNMIDENADSNYCNINYCTIEKIPTRVKINDDEFEILEVESVELEVGLSVR